MDWRIIKYPWLPKKNNDSHTTYENFSMYVKWFLWLWNNPQSKAIKNTQILSNNENNQISKIIPDRIIGQFIDQTQVASSS